MSHHPPLQARASALYRRRLARLVLAVVLDVDACSTAPRPGSRSSFPRHSTFALGVRLFTARSALRICNFVFLARLAAFIRNQSSTLTGPGVYGPMVYESSAWVVRC
ncbi:hypothetical protein OE88DRAFT_60016 [Heliocybe sulcata]|uniref:Secreted protein n=1 Tax=Heliocybe sulcata TaxID=5364 RepID=A0A5C3NGD2_9AGAM|nr:hypothetical protein OE88DRAFT_60016 [Heliocybe sulcata]